MNNIKSGTYTCDNSDLYFKVRVKYRSPKGYFKAKVSMYYKYGVYKGCLVDEGNYKIEYKNITHWKEYGGGKCPFCEVSCGNDHCAYKDQK